MANDTEKRSGLSRGEITWTVIASLFGVAGLFFIVLGIVGDYLPAKASDNWILISETAIATWVGQSFLTYRWWGAILLLIGALIAVVFLNYYARKNDLDEERNVRRQQRLQVLGASMEETKVVEAVVSEPVKKEEKK